MKKVILCLSVLAAFVTGGCSRLHHGAEVSVLHYQCGTLPLTVRQSNRPAQVSFILDGKQLTLPQVASASGVRYDNGRYIFWTKGDGAFIERDGRIVVNDCSLTGAAAVND
ncbi:MliC family protein [Acerihabitans sp. KWT182]|uniref:MliC family protein n=1 Tax=Acerihabitans sp. KWT182 TaxID=3157919 RepID=A0AAU7Q4J3_9GAMM